MKSWRVFAFGLLSASLFALSAPNFQAQAVKIKVSSEGMNGLGGGNATPDGADAEDTADYEAPAEREEFQSLILADMPRPIGFHLETLAEEASKATGVAFESNWFRVDMAALRSDTPFNGKAVADKLGLKIIANYSQHLILAAEETPAAQQAEARVFLYDLFEGKKRRMWSKVLNQRNRNRYSSFGRGIRIVNPRVVNRAKEKKVESKPKTTPFKDLTEKEVFANTGKLSDEKVQAALGLTKEDLDYPLSLRYPLSSFYIGQSNDGGYYPSFNNNFGMMGMPFGGANPFAALDFTGPDRSKNGSILICAKPGISQSDVPEGPSADLIDIESLNPLAMFYGIGRNSWGGRSYYSGDNRNNVVESALFVSMKIDGFTEAQDLEADRLKSFEKQVLTSIELRDADLLRLAQRNAMLYANRNLVPSSFSWADKSALSLLVDPVDEGQYLRSAKRNVVKKMKEGIRKWARSRGDASPAYGRLNNVLGHYGFDGNTLNFDYYDSWNMSLDKPKSEEAVKNSIVLTVGEDRYNGYGKDYPFQVRINFETGDVIWLSGEPESDESLEGRRIEIRKTSEVIANALKGIEAGTATDEAWVREQLKKVEHELLWTSIADYQVTNLIGSFYRVIGDDPNKIYTQRALIETQSGEVTWETLESVPTPEYKSEEKWEEW